jgi:hypothetical protein
MFFGADNQVRLVGPLRSATITITDVTHRTARLSIKRPIHKNAQLSIAVPSCHGNMMPLPIGNKSRAADSLACGRCCNAKRNTTAIERDAIVTIISRPKNITVEHDIAVDPGILSASTGTTGVGIRQGAHPELDSKIRCPYINRTMRRIERNLDPINIASTGSIETQRVPLLCHNVARQQKRHTHEGCNGDDQHNDCDNWQP